MFIRNRDTTTYGHANVRCSMVEGGVVCHGVVTVGLFAGESGGVVCHKLATVGLFAGESGRVVCHRVVTVECLLLITS